MITLRKMTKDEYETWRAISVASYAAEHVRAGNWTAEEAPEEARKAFEHYLPNGLDTERHYVCAVVADETGETVGHLWYAVVPAAGGSATFIYDIGIDEPHRRKGYAAAALKSLEKESARLGASAIRLHVFGNNTAARKLYAGLGYTETDVQMVKTFAAHPAQRTAAASDQENGNVLAPLSSFSAGQPADCERRDPRSPPRLPARSGQTDRHGQENGNLQASHSL